MNIAPNALPATALTAEAPRPVQPPTHESSRPVIAPNPTEAMAQEARRDDAQRTGRQTERKIEHDSQQAHSQDSRRKPASASGSSDPSTTTETRSNNAGVGALLDVFA